MPLEQALPQAPSICFRPPARRPQMSAPRQDWRARARELRPSARFARSTVRRVR